MKKFTALICAAALSLSTVCVSFAASIHTIGPDVVTFQSTQGSIPAEYELKVQDVNLENFKNAQHGEKVANAVKTLNEPEEGTEPTTTSILEALGKKPTQQPVHGTNKTIDPREYEPITKFSDLCLVDKAGNVDYDEKGNVESVTAKIRLDALKGIDNMDQKIILMQIDPETGEVYFIEIGKDAYNSETGEITVTFPCLGPFTVLEKIEEPAETAE